MAASYPQLVLLGDSLLQQSVNTQEGFSMQAELQSRFIRRLDVVNRGFSGWTTANVVEYLSDIFPEPTAASPKIEYLVVLLGANDATLPLPTTSQHIPIDQYKKNLIKIINHPGIQAHKPKILLVTPPPLNEIRLKQVDMGYGHSRATRSSATTASYAEKAREVAHENPGVVLVDLWQALMDKAISMTPQDYTKGGPWLGSPDNGKQGGLESLLPDGLHMNGEAYKVLYEKLKGLIGKEWEALDLTNKTGYVFPDWTVLNPLKK